MIAPLMHCVNNSIPSQQSIEIRNPRKQTFMTYFFRYFFVGILNTAIHWSSFFILHNIIFDDQSISNFFAFLIAATSSFFVNARWTFQSRATGIRYFSFVGFMSLLAYLVGMVSDFVDGEPIYTLAGFSFISLLLGFLYSRYIVFRN